jgi:hypothetical protein
MRSILSLAAVLTLLTAMAPATVLAAAPVRASSEQSGVFCEYATELGDVLFWIQDFDGALFATVLMWEPDAGPDADPIIASFAGSASLTSESVEANLQLGLIPPDETTEPKVVGTAYVTGTLADTGDREDLGSETSRDGNRRVVYEITSHFWSITGTLTIDMVDGSSVRHSLETCNAGAVVQTKFMTDPNAYLTSTHSLYVSCSWVTDQGTVDLVAIVDDVDFSTQIVVGEAGRFLFGFADPALTEESFGATYDLVDPVLGEIVGTAVADADFTATGERVTDVDWFDANRLSVIGERLAVDGTLTITVEGATTQLAMDDASCEAGDVLVQQMEKIARQ